MKKQQPSQIEFESMPFKRRFCNGKKEYNILDNVTKEFTWKKMDRTIMREAKKFDETHKDVLPYFPAAFEVPNEKVRIYCEDGELQVAYNGKVVTMDSELGLKAKLEILKELNDMFPVQVYTAMYHQALHSKKVEDMLKEEMAEVESVQNQESD